MRGLHLNAQQSLVDIALGEKGHAGSRLLEQRPEDDGYDRQDQHGEHPVPLHAAASQHRKQHDADHSRCRNDAEQTADDGAVLQKPPGRSDRDNGAEVDRVFPRDTREAFTQDRRRRRFARPAKPALAADERPQSRQHPDTREAETIAPPVTLAEPPAQQHCGQGAQIDSHVEDGESLIAPHIVGRIQLTDDVRYGGFEETHAHDDAREREVQHADRETVPDHLTVEQGRRRTFERHQSVSAAEQNCSRHDRLSESEVSIGDDAADDGHEVHHRTVGGDEAARKAVVEQEVLRQVEDQQGAHPVIAEPLPHLGEEKHEEPTGMTQQGDFLALGRRTRGGHASGLAALVGACARHCRRASSSVAISSAAANNAREYGF